MKIRIDRNENCGRRRLSESGVVNLAMQILRILALGQFADPYKNTIAAAGHVFDLVVMPRKRASEQFDALTRSGNLRGFLASLFEIVVERVQRFLEFE